MEKKLSKEQAIANHRKMWNWIADKTEERKEIVSKGDYADEVDKTVSTLNSRCWLCEYTLQATNELHFQCGLCPLNWGMEESNCTDGLFEAWSNTYDWKEAARLARAIAKLPVKETKENRKMKYLTRSNDLNLQIETVEEAKRYFLIDVKDMLVEDHRFNEDLMSCKTLDQVADLYNSRTDNLFDGSCLYIREY